MAVSNGTSDGPKTAVDITVRLEKRLHAMRKKYTSPDGTNGNVGADWQGTAGAPKTAAEALGIKDSATAGGVVGAVEAVATSAVTGVEDATALSAEDLKKLKSNNKAELHYLLRHSLCIAFAGLLIVVIVMIVLPDGILTRLGVQGPLRFVPTAVPTKTPPFATTSTTPDPTEASAKAAAILAIVSQQGDEAAAQEALATTIADAHGDDTDKVSSSMAKAKNLQEKATDAWADRSALVKKWMQIKRSQVRGQEPPAIVAATAPQAVAATGGLSVLVFLVLGATFACAVQSPASVALLRRSPGPSGLGSYEPLLG